MHQVLEGESFRGNVCMYQVGFVHFYTKKNGFLYTIGAIQCTPTLFGPYSYIGNKQCTPTECLLCNYRGQTV